MATKDITDAHVCAAIADARAASVAPGRLARQVNAANAALRRSGLGLFVPVAAVAVAA